jgi:hypothetical protein
MHTASLHEFLLPLGLAGIKYIHRETSDACCLFTSVPPATGPSRHKIQLPDASRDATQAATYLLEFPLPLPPYMSYHTDTMQAQ